MAEVEASVDSYFVTKLVKWVWKRYNMKYAVLYITFHGLCWNDFWLEAGSVYTETVTSQLLCYTCNPLPKFLLITWPPSTTGTTELFRVTRYRDAAGSPHWNATWGGAGLVKEVHWLRSVGAWSEWRGRLSALAWHRPSTLAWHSPSAMWVTSWDCWFTVFIEIIGFYSHGQQLKRYRNIPQLRKTVQ